MVPALALRLEVFTRLSQDDRAAISKVSKVSRVVPPRRDLIREGESPKHVHLMVDGWACRYKTLPDGRRQIVAFFVPGDLCDLNVYILKEMDHSIGAITRLAVADINRDDMDRLTADHPRITQALWWEALVNIAVQREWTLNIGQRTAYERIAHLLVELFMRLRSVGQTQADSCDFPLTQTDIADATGLTAVHVNRTLQELRRDGLIVLERKRLQIPNLRKLKDAAMFNPNYLHLDHEGRHLDANE
ncbi:MAG TPA: Crp/Fnr family transcriptional regulator [Sphingomicrobium sp.]